MKLIFNIIVLFISTAAFAENIQYEIYKKSTGTLISSGVKEYVVTDIILNPYTSRGEKVVEKFIELEQGFKIGARIFSELKLTGFGLVAELEEHDGVTMVMHGQGYKDMNPPMKHLFDWITDEKLAHKIGRGYTIFTKNKG